MNREMRTQNLGGVSELSLSPTQEREVMDGFDLDEVRKELERHQAEQASKPAWVVCRSLEDAQALAEYIVYFEAKKARRNRMDKVHSDVK